MTDAERLADLRERFGPAATRVGDPPTAADVALLLRMLDAERAAVVAWLRMKSSKQKKEAEGAMTPWYAAEQDALSCENATNADAIERGEHRK